VSLDARKRATWYIAHFLSQGDQGEAGCNAWR